MNKFCPDCGMKKKKVSLRCPMCGGAVSYDQTLNHKCGSPPPPQRKVPFEKLATGALLDFQDDGLHDPTKHTGQFYANPFLTKEQIRQAFDYYATPEEIERLYMKHCVSDDPVNVSDTGDESDFFARYAFNVRFDLTSNEQARMLANFLNRFIKNGVKK